MIGQGAKITRKKEQAVAALIEQPTIRDAAQVADIGEATLFRWLQDPSFQSAYRDAKRRVVDQAISRLQRASSEAVETLRTIMNDRGKPASARVMAARTVLEYAVEAIEIEDLTERVEELEASRDGYGASTCRCGGGNHV